MFHSLFSEQADKMTRVKVEMKNKLEIEGNLKSVDQNMNLVLTNITTPDTYSALFLSSSEILIRGSLIKYINFSSDNIDLTQLRNSMKKQS